MPNIYLYGGEVTPSNIKLSDPTVLRGGVVARTLAADGGSFALTGGSTNLLYNRRLVASGASFNLSGTPANLLYNRILAAASGSFAYNGSDAGLLIGRVLVSESGIFVYSGFDADLIKAGTPQNYVLTAEGGVFLLNGFEVTFTFSEAPPPLKATLFPSPPRLMDVKMLANARNFRRGYFTPGWRWRKPH
jgi:hypothetical protein